MSTDTMTDHPGQPRLHQGHPRGDLGRDHQARVDRALRLRRRVDYDLRAGGAYKAYASEAMKQAGAAGGFPVPDVVVDGEVIEADPPRGSSRRCAC